MQVRGLVFAFLFQVVLCSVSLCETLIVERDLKYSLTYFDRFQNAFLPLEYSSIDRELLYLHLEANDLLGKKLRFVASGNVKVFVNDALKEDIVSGDTLLVDFNTYSKDKQGNLDFTFYSKGGLPSIILLEVVIKGM